MAKDDSNISPPKRGAFPVPKDVLENAKPYRTDQDKPEGNAPEPSSGSAEESQEKPDEKSEKESSPPK